MSQYKLENLTSVIDNMNFLKIKPIVTLHRTSHRAEIAASMLAATGREVMAVCDGQDHAWWCDLAVIAKE